MAILLELPLTESMIGITVLPTAPTPPPPSTPALTRKRWEYVSKFEVSLVYTALGEIGLLTVRPSLSQKQRGLQR